MGIIFRVDGSNEPLIVEGDDGNVVIGKYQRFDHLERLVAHYSSRPDIFLHTLILRAQQGYTDKHEDDWRELYRFESFDNIVTEVPHDFFLLQKIQHDTSLPRIPYIGESMHEKDSYHIRCEMHSKPQKPCLVYPFTNDNEELIYATEHGSVHITLDTSDVIHLQDHLLSLIHI